MLASALELAAVTALSATAALPPIIGARNLLRRARCVPLLRGALEENAVLASCAASAIGSLALADGISSLASPAFATLLLGFAAPLPLGVAPWLAGEVLSGRSQRHLLALLASLAASCAASWVTFALCWASFSPARLSPPIAAIQFAGALAAALCAGRAYLAVRGEAPEVIPAR